MFVELIELLFIVIIGTILGNVLAILILFALARLKVE